jgi:hypothetical protein
MAQTLPGEEFLNPFYLDQELREVTEPLLYFNGVLPNTDATERDIIYDQIKNTAAADLEDGVMSLPMPSGEESALTKLKMRNISRMEGSIPKIGYEMDISRDVLASKERTLSDLNLKMKKAGYGIAYMCNKLTLDALAAGAKTSTYSVPYVWDSATGKQNPIADLLGAYYDFKVKGYGNRAMNWFFNENNHQELTQYLTDNDIDFVFSGEDKIQITGKTAVSNLEIRDVGDQYTEGSYLAMDLRPQVHPGAETFRYIDPKFAVEKANPDQTEVPDYTGMHINVTTMDKNPFTTTVEAWVNFLPVVKVEDVIMNGTGV